MRTRRTGAALATLAVVALTGCPGDDGGDDDGRRGDQDPSSCCTGAEVELDLLAGSELLDMQPILDRAAEDTGVTVTLHPVGTLAGIQQVVAGEVGDVDGLWFSSNRYLGLHGAADRIQEEQPIMSSPVLLGVAADRAAELGWEEGGVAWSDIAAAAADDRFSYGMTDPGSSNSGLSGLVGVATALSGEGDPIDADDVDGAAEQLTAFFRGRDLTDATSGDLAAHYVARRSGEEAGPVVDGLVNYESVLLSLNEGPLADDPFEIVYPTDGTVVADYPLTLLTGAPDEVRDGYDRLRRWLRTPDVQREIMDTTHRRPSIPDLDVGDRFGSAPELPFPVDLAVLERLVDAYYDRYRKPVRTVYVLDVSGSMEEDDRIGRLREALVALTGSVDAANPAHQIHAREEVTFLPFSTLPQEPRSFVVPEAGRDAALAQVRAAAEGLVIGGDTAIYDSLRRAYDLLAGDDGYAESIVLMTDGENNEGMAFADFTSFHAGLPPAAQDIPLYVVHLGDANVSEMEQLTALTGQEPIDATQEGLAAAFEDIRSGL